METFWLLQFHWQIRLCNYVVFVLHGDIILNDYLILMILKYDENCMCNLSESTIKTIAIMFYHNRLACSIKEFYHTILLEDFMMEFNKLQSRTWTWFNFT